MSKYAVISGPYFPAFGLHTGRYCNDYSVLQYYSNYTLTVSLVQLFQNNYLTYQQKQPPEVFCKKDLLRNFAKFTGKHLFNGLCLNKVAGLVCNFIKKKTLAQVFSREFC